MQSSSCSTIHISTFLSIPQVQTTEWYLLHPCLVKKYYSVMVFYNIRSAFLYRLKSQKPQSSSLHQSMCAKRYTLVCSVFIVDILTQSLLGLHFFRRRCYSLPKVVYSSDTHIIPYVTASAIDTATPNIPNFMLTSITANVNPCRALAFDAFLLAIVLACSLVASSLSSILVRNFFRGSILLGLSAVHCLLRLSPFNDEYCFCN